MKHSNRNQNTEIITFRRGDEVATVATNGKRHVSQIGAKALEHGSLTMAISYLECKGFSIDPSSSKGL